MKFVIDAQLPRRLARRLGDLGHDAIHIFDLPAGNRTTDAEICRFADLDGRVVVVTKRPSDYDAAITLLKDLHEIGQTKGQTAKVAERIRALREAHAKKPSFLARMRKAGL